MSTEAIDRANQDTDAAFAQAIEPRGHASAHETNIHSPQSVTLTTVLKDIDGELWALPMAPADKWKAEALLSAMVECEKAKVSGTVLTAVGIELAALLATTDSHHVEPLKVVLKL